MDAPTFQLTSYGLGGGNNLRVINPPAGTSFIGVPQLNRKVVAPIQTVLNLSGVKTLQWGNPAARKAAGKPIVADKSTIDYLFIFYYASNSKIPGSPIPRAGQVSPRPL
jgi:hypothetical protein